MACVNPDGSLSGTAKAVLGVLAGTALTPEKIAAATGTPLFRVRSGLREMAAAGLVGETADGFAITDKGRGMM